MQRHAEKPEAKEPEEKTVKRGLIMMTGNYTVDAITQLHITGNVIPENWYKAIIKPSGKPYLNAIIILSDLVYWYRAAEVRDDYMLSIQLQKM